MASALSSSKHPHIEANQPETPCWNPPVIRPASRLTTAFSSRTLFSSVSSSYSFYDYPLSTPLKLSKIPFSWEQIPGISKQESPKEKDSTKFLLPLPPARNPSKPIRKQGSEEKSPNKISGCKNLKRDPFFVALIECSKDDDDDHHGSLGNIWKSLKVTKGKNYPLGTLGTYASCKRTCAVSESVVYLPRSRPYNLIDRRSN